MRPHPVRAPLQGSGVPASARQVVERRSRGARHAGKSDRKPLFQRLFGLVLTDNGAEFSDAAALERSAFHGTARCKVHYCDVRQSQQKGGCERNHVELRKLLPKGRGISFDDLDGRDMAVLMSQLNSEPRPSLMGLSPTAMLKAADPEAAAALMDALGIVEVPYGKLDLMIDAIDRDWRERGLPPLTYACQIPDLPDHRETQPSG